MTTEPKMTLEEIDLHSSTMLDALLAGNKSPEDRFRLAWEAVYALRAAKAAAAAKAA